MKNLYHGSKISKMEIIEPHQSTHGNYVYATKYKELAIIFSKKAGDDLTYSLFKDKETGIWQLVERIPDGFQLMFNNESSIYTVSPETFKDIETGFAEFVSEVPVNPQNEEKINNVYEELLKLNKQGVIKIYHYPTRPSRIPKDDTDLIEKEIKMANIRNKKITYKIFIRLLFLHPHLLEKINYYGLSIEPNFKSFIKEDLINIYEAMLLSQINTPTQEFFIPSALKNISKIYPELLPDIKKITEQYLNKNQKTKSH